MTKLHTSSTYKNESEVPPDVGTARRSILRQHSTVRANDHLDVTPFPGYLGAKINRLLLDADCLVEFPEEVVAPISVVVGVTTTTDELLLAFFPKDLANASSCFSRFPGVHHIPPLLGAELGIGSIG